MAFAFARLAARTSSYQLTVGADFQSPEVLGGIFRQAILAYEFGDGATRQAVEQFWYNFALGGGLSILETEVNISEFVRAGFCADRTPAPVMADRAIVPILDSLRGILVRERTGVLGYLLHSNPEQSISECIASATALALTLKSTDLALYK